MLLTISTTQSPATDLGFLLHKNPSGINETEFGFGKATVFWPEATDERATVALLVDVDTINLVRNHKGPQGNDFSLSQYVNDRPYAASSFLSVALGKVFGTALTGRSKERQELAGQAIPLEVSLPVVPCRGGEAFFRRIFEPLGYEVDVIVLPLDEQFSDWGNSRYLSVALKTTAILRDALEHLFVLLPVLDDDKHYWVGDDEVEKLLRRGGDWLGMHPEKDAIAKRYLRHDRKLANSALAQLMDDDNPEIEDAAPVKRPPGLNDQRVEKVINTLKDLGAQRVIDLGCGEGRLIREMLKETQFQYVLGMDVSYKALQMAAKRLYFDTMTPRQRERVDVVQGSLMYRDARLEGFDAAAVVEVIEHLDEPRLEAFERAVFAYAQPKAVIVTTPNVEYNVRFEAMTPGTMRHRDHRFEWTRPEFETWAARICGTYGYEVSFDGIGPVDQEVGTPTQMAVFTR